MQFRNTSIFMAWLLCVSVFFGHSQIVNAQQIEYPVDSNTKLYSKEGVASFYANKFHGKRTANGDRYHKNKLTAAHRTLPFGTLVKVTSLKNGKWVIVRINDRGPYNRKRTIDLSYRAAKHLGMVNGKGITRVKVEELPPRSIPSLENDEVVGPSKE